MILTGFYQVVFWKSSEWIFCHNCINVPHSINLPPMSTGVQPEGSDVCDPTHFCHDLTPRIRFSLMHFMAFYYPQCISGFRENGLASGSNGKLKEPQINHRNTAKCSKMDCCSVCVCVRMKNETLPTADIEREWQQSVIKPDVCLKALVTWINISVFSLRADLVLISDVIIIISFPSSSLNINTLTVINEQIHYRRLCI